jgi:hypothetical protein
MLHQYREGSHSTVTHMGETILVDNLLKLTQTQEYPRLVKVSDLVWILSETKVDQDRVTKADTRFPLIVLQEHSGRLVVLDGVHRLTKLMRQYTQFARCFIVTETDLKVMCHG